MAKAKSIIPKKVLLSGPNKETYHVWWQEITPGIAAKFLGKMGRQRKLSPDQVRKLTHELVDGNWDDLNGDTLVFNKEGQLLDGQHRLQAIVASKCTMAVFCIQGVRSDAYFSLDQQHKNRTLSDLLGMMKEHRPNELAGSLSYMAKYKHGVLANIANRGGYALTNREAFKILKRHPGLRDSVTWASPALRNAPVRICSAGALGFLHYVLSRIDREYATRFLNILVFTGEPTDTDCPARLCRSLIDKSLKHRDLRMRMSFVERLACILKTWNYFIIDKRLATSKPLGWPSGECFPQIQDRDAHVIGYVQIRDVSKGDR